jgi:iron complex transport system substrate-binding protein
MKMANLGAKLLTAVLVLAFAWATVRSGSVGNVADQSKRPKEKRTPRQIAVLSETSDCRLVKHPLGETKVPLAPQRIVSLVSSATDSLLALDVKPVLATTSLASETSVSYLSELLKGVPLIRSTGGVDLETIATAHPDLIFASSRESRIYNQLSKIAPTVVLTTDANPDKENRILDVGDVIGKSADAKARLKLFRKHVADAKAQLSERVAGQPVVFLRFRLNTCVIYTQATMFGPLLFDQLGLAPDPSMPMVMLNSGGWDVLSVERLSTLQAEHIFMVVDRDSEWYLKRVAETPIWRQLPAVQHHHVYRVPSGTWLGGDGVLGSEAIVNDVLSAMVPSESAHATF